MNDLIKSPSASSAPPAPLLPRRVPQPRCPGQRLPDVAGTQPALWSSPPTDVQQFNKAVSALSQAGIRYETTLGSAPYLIRVELRAVRRAAGDPQQGRLSEQRPRNQRIPGWLQHGVPGSQSDSSGPTSAAGKSSSCSWRAWTSSPRQGPGVGRPGLPLCRKNNDRGVSVVLCAASTPQAPHRPSPGRTDPERHQRRSEPHHHRRPALQLDLRRRHE